MSCYEDTRRERSGNNQQALNTDLVEQIPIPVPALAEQMRIVTEVAHRLSILREVEVEIEANFKRADGLRQPILGKSFSVGTFAAQ